MGHRKNGVTTLDPETTLTEKTKTLISLRDHQRAYGKILRLVCRNTLRRMQMSKRPKENIEQMENTTGHGVEHETITASERRFHEALIEMLIQKKYVGDVLVNWLMAIPLGSLRKTYQEVFKHLKSHNKQKFSLRRGDVFLPRVGLLIEIDGEVHDSYVTKIARDSLLDDEMAKLGIRVHRIANRDVWNSSELSRHLKIVEQLIDEEIRSADFKRNEKFRRNKVSRILNQYRREGAAKFDRAYTRDGLLPSHPNLKCIVENGGYRVSIGSKGIPKKSLDLAKTIQ